MFLNNNQFSKKKETFVLFSLILISVLIRIPVILIFGDSNLENEWGVLVNEGCGFRPGGSLYFDSRPQS